MMMICCCCGHVVVMMMVVMQDIVMHRCIDVDVMMWKSGRSRGTCLRRWRRSSSSCSRRRNSVYPWKANFVQSHFLKSQLFSSTNETLSLPLIFPEPKQLAHSVQQMVIVSAPGCRIVNKYSVVALMMRGIEEGKHLSSHQSSDSICRISAVLN